MSTKNSHAIIRETFLKDASSYIIPVLIVLAAMILSMGNWFSVHAEEPTLEASSSPTISSEVFTVNGSAGYVSGSAGYIGNEVQEVVAK